MNLPNLLAHHARKFPDKEAIVTPTERLTYKEWDRCVNKLATASGSSELAVAIKSCSICRTRKNF